MCRKREVLTPPLDFHSCAYPDPPAYLGKPQKSACGYHQKSCLTGCYFHSKTIPSGSKVEILSMSIKYTVDGVEKTCGYFPEGLDYHNITESVRELECMGSTSEAVYKDWLKILVPHTEPRPSEKHFLGVVHGFGSYYKCDTQDYDSYNPHASMFISAFWFERWPIQKEVESMKRSLGEGFYFGIPPKHNLHGN